MITKRDLEVLAETLRDADYLNDYLRGQLANDLVTALRPINPRIDRARFVKASLAIEDQRE